MGEVACVQESLRSKVQHAPSDRDANALERPACLLTFQARAGDPMTRPQACLGNSDMLSAFCREVIRDAQCHGTPMKVL